MARAQALLALAIVAAALGCEGGGTSAEDVGPVADTPKGGASDTKEDVANLVGDVGSPQADAARGSAVWCQPCVSQADCGEAARCIADANDETYCATSCLLSKNECPAGATCRPYGSKTDEFACQPDYGSCRGAGEPCSPCDLDGDCQAGNVCRTSKIDKERSCFRACTSKGQCSDGQSCEDGLCLPFVANKYRQVCNVGTSGRCEPCSYNYECADGLLCGPKLGYCTEKCTKEQGLDNSCPEGLFCVDDYCQPPVMFKCQGWLGCAYGCPDGTLCEKGVCVGP